MSIFHAIIVILFVYLVIRSLLRGRPDPISDRLVARPYALDMEAMKVEGSRRQRETDARLQREWEARLRAEDYHSACERYRIARLRRMNGYGTAADLETERAFFATYRPLDGYGRQ